MSRKFIFGGSFLSIPPLDPDAEAFLTAAAITDPTITSAIDTLVKDLKTANIWTKMKAIYPFVGDTASTHKWNLKDPRDLDAAFRLAFSGGWTHNANGITGNALNSFTNTFLNPSLELTVNSTHVSIYSRTNIAQNGIDCGANIATNDRIAIHLKWSDNNSYHDMYAGSGSGRISFASSAINSTKFYITNRSASNVFKVFRDGNLMGSQLSAQSNSLPNRNLYIGAMNSPPTQFITSRNYAFASIGDGLTDPDCAALTTAVNNFQATLSRNV
jgi:hypothetical protein